MLIDQIIVIKAQFIYVLLCYIHLGTQLRPDQKVQEMIDTFSNAGLTLSDVPESRRKFHKMLTNTFFPRNYTLWEHLAWVC